jgi:hypothetical protein
MQQVVADEVYQGIYPTFVDEPEKSRQKFVRVYSLYLKSVPPIDFAVVLVRLVWQSRLLVDIGCSDLCGNGDFSGARTGNIHGR